MCEAQQIEPFQPGFSMIRARPGSQEFFGRRSDGSGAAPNACFERPALLGGGCWQMLLESSEQDLGADVDVGVDAFMEPAFIAQFLRLT